MGFTEDMICNNCGKTFSCLFGRNKETTKNFEGVFKKEYGEKAHQQLVEIMNNIENGCEIKIDDYNHFSEIKYDLDFKVNYLRKKLDDLAEQIAIQDKERKNDVSGFKFVAETFYWKYVEGYDALKEIIESGDEEAILEAFNEKWVLFEGKKFGHTLFKCPNCDKYEGGFYTHIETSDARYECNHICPNCETAMEIYNGCLSDGVRNKELSCSYCGSDNVIVKDGLIVD